MIRKIFFGLMVTFIACTFAFGQSELKYVHLSDIHVGSATGADDLRRTIKDINENPDIQFVIITGDITEFGAD
ncbi:MAG TPA: metallophosphoesterase, partial [Chitinophagaceae bacterium]|nr:metallophosphoesterase [Chitinophagaceae bacterium]